MNIILNCCVVFMSCFYTEIAFSQVAFLKQPDWNNVLTKAKNENKFILVDCYLEHCGPCAAADKYVFGDTSVSNYLNKLFINVKIDLRLFQGKDFAMKFHIWKLPTFLIFSSSGKLISPVVGTTDAKEFIEIVNKIIAIPKSQYPKGISSSIKLSYPDFYIRSFGGKQVDYNAEPDSISLFSYLTQAQDLSTEVNWSIVCRFIKTIHSYNTKYTFFIDDWILTNAEVLRSLYPTKEVKDVIAEVINKKYRDILHLKNEDTFRTNILPLIDKHLVDKNIKITYQISFYVDVHDYGKAIQFLSDSSAKYNIDNTLINSTCDLIYKNVMSGEILKMSTELMRQVVNKEPTYNSIKTYSLLLYKTKDYVNADRYAEYAVQVGKKEGYNVTEMQKILSQIRQRL